MTIEDDLILRNPDAGSNPDLWPRLSCNAPNQVILAASNPALDQNPTLFFQGNGQLKAVANLRFLTGTPASEKVVVLESGNVGIGEANPTTAKLVVNGNLKLQQGIAVNEFSSDGNLTDNSDLTIPTEKAVKAYVDSKIAQIDAVLPSKAASGGSGTQDFQTNNLTVQGNLITHNQSKVGIGTTPMAPLHISGGNWNPNDSDCDLRLGDNTYKFKLGIAKGGAGAGDVRLRAQGGTNRMMLGCANNDVLTIQNNNVGIGTTTPDPQSALHVIGNLLGAAKGSSGEQLRIAVGYTPPGSTTWQAYSANAIFVNVDTSSAGFTSTPYYFTSMGGDSNHWIAVGATSIYSPSPRGFTVYLRFLDGNITPAQANSMRWFIRWVAIGN